MCQTVQFNSCLCFSPLAKLIEQLKGNREKGRQKGTTDGRQDLKCLKYLIYECNVFQTGNHLMYFISRILRKKHQGGGIFIRAALEQTLFVVLKIGSKLKLFFMRPLRARFGKICQWTKNIKDVVVYGWGNKTFPQSPKENKNSINMSSACLFKKTDAKHFIILFAKPFYQCSHKNLDL